MYHYIGIVLELDAFLEELHHRFPTVSMVSQPTSAGPEHVVHLACAERDVITTAVRYLFSDEGMEDPALDITRS